MDLRKKGMAVFACVIFIASTIFFTFGANNTFAVTSMLPDEKKLGEICIREVVPYADIDDAVSEPEEEDKEETKIAEKENAETNKKKTEKKEIVSITEEPLVIIYHTHSSESYMPYTESNYHREEPNGTVREVGDVLEEELEKMGINVIHDKTVHDRPSYNESYNKSLATIESLAKKYPTARYIIDLHRDAAASSATEGKYTIIDGKRVAKFSMVVGQANENYVELYDFAQKVSERAEEMYEGFGGAIIEKNYYYNEYISDNALLLEVGNNKNTIEEANECGRYFANVLASLIKENE